MRKALILFLVVLIACSALFITAHCLVNANKDRVTWQETVYLGDSSAVAGANVQVNSMCQRHLLWQTEGTLGGKLEPVTTFTFSNDDITWNMPMAYCGLSMYPAIDLHIMTNSSDAMPEYAQEVYADLIAFYEDAYANSPVGEETFYTVDMTEYMECYPWEGYFDIPSGEGYGASSWSEFDGAWYMSIPDETIEAVRDFFQIPILGEYKIEFSINRISDNRSSLGGSVLEMTYEPSFHGVATEEAAYFTFNPIAPDGQTADVGRIPGGYGIYTFAVSETEQGTRVPNVSCLTMVYPLDITEEFVNLMLSDDQKHLYLHTIKDGSYMRTIIDIDTMTQLQKFEVRQEREDEFYRMHQYDDFFVVLEYGGENSISVFEEDENGLYHFCYKVPMDTDAFRPSEEMDILGYADFDMDFNGETLVMIQNWAVTDFYDTVSSDMEGNVFHYSYMDSVDFHVVAYDAGGMLYAALHETSLADINKTDYDWPILPMYELPVTISW